jgi:serine protease Do
MQSKKTYKDTKRVSIIGGITGSLFTLAIVTFIILTQPIDALLPNTNTVATGNMTVSAVDVSDIVAEVNPAVVAITITEDVPVYESVDLDTLGDFFSHPFFSQPSLRQNGTEEKEVGGGSGFLISSDGYIVTNAHVVSSEAAAYTVNTTSGDEYIAEIIARDDILDIAVLKIEAASMPFLTFGNSDIIRLGQGVIAIGNALAEYSNSVSTGVVSGLSRSIIAGDSAGNSEILDNVIQTDAAINPGNSGGPLLDFSGAVIGVNVAVASGSENIAFSLPANAVKQTVDSIIEHGRIIRPYLGVHYAPVEYIFGADLPVDYGAYISSDTEENPIVASSPAEAAGLQDGDIILEVDEVRLEGAHTLAREIQTKEVGQQVELTVLRGEEKIIIYATLQEMPIEEE